MPQDNFFTSSFGAPEIIVALSLGLFIVWTCRLSTKRHRYPPGPPGNILVGNILEVPSSGAWYKLTEDKNVYGDLVYFHGLGNRILVLNSLQAITQLFEKRGAIYSDRPSFTVVGELMDLGQSMALLSYGDEWKAHRRLAHVALSAGAVKRYYPIQEDLAALLCQALVESPEEFFGHFRLASARLIMTITYGLSVNTADSEYITHAEDTMEMISQATVPGAFLCDLIPCMKYLPSWMPFQKFASRGRKMIEQFINKPFEQVMREMDAGIAPPSLTQDLLSREGGDSPTLKHQIKWTSGALFGAGGETTYSTVLTCIMAMALHPETLRKAQVELDRVVGTERMPRIDDRAGLPYVDAVIKETLRWHPSVPLGFARTLAKDDVYEGFYIPKGTILVPNVWAIAFAPHGPYDPYAFAPERFLVPDGDDLPPDPAVWAFGFARRICPGRYLAENSVFILIATILAMFDISLPEGAELKPKFTKGLVSYPEPFECRFTVRSDAKLAQIRTRVGQCTV